MNETIHPPAIQATLDIWHEMVAAADLGRLPEIVHKDAVFRSPMAFTPYHGSMALCLALKTVLEVFSDFTYHRELATGDGTSVVLEFSASVGDRKLKGIDLIRFDENGLITEFEVMVRPMSGLAALGAEMGKRIGGELKAFA